MLRKSLCAGILFKQICQLDEVTFKTHQSAQIIPKDLLFNNLLFINFKYAEGSYLNVQNNTPLDEDHTIACLAKFNENILSYYILDAYYVDFFLNL